MWVAMKKSLMATQMTTLVGHNAKPLREWLRVIVTMETLPLYCELNKTSCSNTHLPFHAHSRSYSYGKRSFL